VRRIKAFADYLRLIWFLKMEFEPALKSCIKKALR
jgi:hypothetical protein